MTTEEIINHFLNIYLTPAIRDAVREEMRKHSHYQKPVAPEDELLSAQEAAAFIGDALPTFYGRTSRGEIATYGSGKRIFIKKSELLTWMQKQRTKSIVQINEEATHALRKKNSRTKNL